MGSVAFRQFLAIGSMSLLVTFVVFHFLESFARGTGEVLGGTIQYGGALGGFVVIFWLFFLAYSRMVSKEESTAIHLDGEWKLELYTKDGKETRQGEAVVRQLKGRSRLHVTGHMESTLNPPAVTFHTEVGVLKGQRFVFMYRNSRQEMGIAFGDIPQNRPRHFTVSFYDVLSMDVDGTPEGQILFYREGHKPG